MNYEEIYRCILLGAGIFAVISLLQCTILKWKAPVEPTIEYYNNLGRCFMQFIVGVGILMLTLIVKAFHQEYYPWI